MRAAVIRSAALTGTLLVLVYTLLISSADAITKLLAGGYAAPQLYFVSGLLGVGMALTADRVKSGPRQGLRTSCPRAMAVRSVATVVSVTCYFYAFRLLPFAEVFVFIGLVPLLGFPALFMVMALMNLQFVWMVILGAVFFGEVPGGHIYLGVAIVIASGTYLVYERIAADRRVTRPAVIPAE